MRWRVILVTIICIGAAVLVPCAGSIWRLIEEGPAGIHQAGVKRELAGWAKESASPRDWHEAWRAAEILEYTRTYYIPGEGYRGSPQTEADLGAQRTRTRAAISAGLREFTGQDFGVDAARWQEWLRQHRHADLK